MQCTATAPPTANRAPTADGEKRIGSTKPSTGRDSSPKERDAEKALEAALNALRQALDPQWLTNRNGGLTQSGVDRLIRDGTTAVDAQAALKAARAGTRQ